MRWRKKKKNGWPGMVENVRPYAETVGAKAGPMVESAGQRLSGAMSDAAEASEPYRREAALRGRAAWVALCGGDPGQVLRSRHSNRRWVLIGGLTVLAVGAGVAYWMIRTAPPSPWHPNASDDITAGGRGAESQQAPESESTGESTGPTRASKDAKPASPPHQRTGGNSTKSSR